MYWGIRGVLVLVSIMLLSACQSTQSQSTLSKNDKQLAKSFVTVWRVSSHDLSITIPTNPSFLYRYAVEWGDGQHDSDLNASITHTYKKAGDYTVSISGIFPHLYMITGDRLLAMNRLEGENASKLVRLISWGDLAWKSMHNMFAYCTDIELDTSTRPDMSHVHSMRNMFYGTARFDSDISDWNVSTVTDMRGMFYETSRFNQPLNRWDVSRVTDMSRMFAFATRFNHPLRDWNVSAVTTMESMFKGAAKFNQPLNAWNVSRVTDMGWMFAYAKAFNQPLKDWDVSHVTRTRDMFRFAKSFHDQDLSRWDLSQVKKRKDFLKGAGAGNILPSWP